MGKRKKKKRIPKYKGALIEVKDPEQMLERFKNMGPDKAMDYKSPLGGLTKREAFIMLNEGMLEHGPEALLPQNLPHDLVFTLSLHDEEFMGVGLMAATYIKGFTSKGRFEATDEQMMEYYQFYSIACELEQLYRMGFIEEVLTEATLENILERDTQLGFKMSPEAMAMAEQVKAMHN